MSLRNLPALARTSSNVPRYCAIFFGLLVFFPITSGSATAATLRVPSAEYPTIQSGLDAASLGDTVLVAPGTYTGEGNRNLDFNGRAIVLRSEAGSAGTVIDVAASSSEPGRGAAFLNSEPPEAIFEGFTIENGYISTGIIEEEPGKRAKSSLADGERTRQRSSASRHKLSGGGVTIQWFSSPTLKDIVIRDCHSDFTGGGLSVETYARPEFIGCVVQSCSANLQGGGLSIETFSVTRFVECVFTGNESPLGGGISASAEATFERCTVAGNRSAEGGGMWIGLPAVLALQRVIVWGNCSANPGRDIVTTLGTTSQWACSIVDSSAVLVDGIVEYDSATTHGDPLFCDPGSCENAPTDAGDYGIGPKSPASSERSRCGARIGALDGMCDPPPATLDSSWGAIKARFSTGTVEP